MVKLDRGQCRSANQGKEAAISYNMQTTLERWPFRQLEALAERDAELAEKVLDSLWEAHPGLLDRLVVGAVRSGELSLQRASERLSIEPDVLARRLADISGAASSCDDDAIVFRQTPKGPEARLAESNLCVWEVVREYRKLGSIEAVKELFPNVTRSELHNAIRYAESHSSEIQAQIDEFEAQIQRKRAEYPFAG